MLSKYEICLKRSDSSISSARNYLSFHPTVNHKCNRLCGNIERLLERFDIGEMSSDSKADVILLSLTIRNLEDWLVELSNE